MTAKRADGSVDRRRFLRWRIDLPAQEVEPEEHVFRCTSVSEGGLFWPNAAPRPLGSRLVVELELDDRQEALRIPGRVANVGRSLFGLGLGIEFDEPQEEVADFLDRLAAGRAFTPQ